MSVSAAVSATAGCFGSSYYRTLTIRDTAVNGNQISFTAEATARSGTEEWKRFENVSFVGYDSDGVICEAQVGSIDPLSQSKVEVVLECPRLPTYITARVDNPCSGGQTDISIYKRTDEEDNLPYIEVGSRECPHKELPTP